METTDVVICGCGPTGAMLSGYLGQMGVRNIVLEREARITTDPRGIALDEDGIRLLQGLGIYDQVYTDIGTYMNKFLFIGGTATVLNRKPFMQFDYDTTEGGTGHMGFICHKQPVLEKHLREVMDRWEACELRTQCAVTELAEDENWTYCRYIDGNGKAKQIRSRFFVGADGKTGFTRKEYLESRGVKLERLHNMFYEETWVAVNWKIELPTRTSHPEFPLWKLSYNPEQVPAVCGRFGLPHDRLWRFEYAILATEDGHEMAKPEKMKKVIYPYITHAGHQYGLSTDIQYPEDCITVLRSRAFLFSARSCNRWSEGRVVLCGDAAHVFPPFGGQGIASGFRDASSLAWRLALLCRSPTQSLASSRNILASWYMERKQQLEKSLRATIENGEFVNEKNPAKILLRTCFFWIMSFIPGWSHRMRLGQRREGMTKYQHEPGMPFMPQFDGGRCLPQVYCKLLDKGKSELLFTDDIIFDPRKRGLFRVLVYLRTLQELVQARHDIGDLHAISQGELDMNDVTFLVGETSPQVEESKEDLSSVVRIATGAEFANSALCNGRLPPYFYDPYRLGKEIKQKKYIILRPDRFIFAACGTKDEFQNALHNAVAYSRV
ncbi:hypothetical protein NM208_g5926 [Fusarium decemcellulare]|uniref:Uncharacterized protein n=1 Tax=Fusarium decemcellulare TaxID=57161 RepID=A0ACC1SFA7_9HYPO|nr:hypothetical protein NM208_g5926 [Fusarium decemcellulare]